MISLYDKLIDNLSHYAVPYEDHPQQSTRDFEYDHPLTGIENDRIVNIDNSSSAVGSNSVVQNKSNPTLSKHITSVNIFNIKSNGYM